MPIERFQTYTDTTPAGKVNFHDYIFDVTPEVKADEKNWVPYIDGVHLSRSGSAPAASRASRTFCASSPGSS
jgi:hypothetical protein